MKKKTPSWYTKLMNCRNNKISSNIKEDQQKDEALDSNENQTKEMEWDPFEYRLNICLGLTFEQLIGSSIFFSLESKVWTINSFEKS